MLTTSVHIFGIRHHGPGSARSVRAALENLRPDVILVEGPPEGESVLPLVTHPEMKPPVALLLYVPDEPKKAVYYPFAVFSPEWQALQFGLTNNIPVRFMDLPQTHQLGEKPEAGEETEDRPPIDPIRRDPIKALAEAAGYSESERWWEHMVEHRRGGDDLFMAIREAMGALREEAGPDPEIRERRREAYMRRTIRKAQSEGFANIAVVCGAWHAPALADLDNAKEDESLLAGLPKTKIAATWVPWTNGRLTFASGYGAGIESPGWYHHIWTCPDGIANRWMTRVAHLLREKDLDVSPASVIESVRLAETLAALRGRPLPGLPEMNESVQTVFCFGSDLPLRLIAEQLIVGETLGAVPAETPMVPLQQDLEKEQRRLRLPAEAAQRVLDLDLRNDTDLARSCLLHRLDLLGIPWGRAERFGGGKGTFHELWRLQWQPELSVAVIEAGAWGNTVEAAAGSFARDRAEKSPDLPSLTHLLDKVLLAQLPDAVVGLMRKLEAEAALASDAALLMDALPPLVNIARYGNVRRTDATQVGHVIDGLLARITIGLPGACASLDDDAARAMLERLVAVHSAVGILQNEEHTRDWQQALQHLADQSGLHGLVAGRATRLLLDAGVFTTEEAARRLGLALSTGSEPAQAAAWVEGFLQGSGQLLLHDQALWAVLDTWVSELNGDIFLNLLPLLRRTFATFTQPERRQIGERAKQGGPSNAQVAADEGEFDTALAEVTLPLVARLLGISLDTAV